MTETSQEEFSQETRRTGSAALVLLPRSEAVVVGFALLGDFECRVRQFNDNAGTLPLVESLLLQERCTTCFVNGGKDTDGAKKAIHRVAERCGVRLTFAPASEFSQQIDVQNLKRILLSEEQHSLLARDGFQDSDPAGRALAYLLRRCAILEDPANYGQFTLTTVSLDRVMRLDRSAFSALHIMPAAKESVRAATNLVGYLNRCCTKAGQSMLIRWIAQPSADIFEIRQRHDVVELLLKCSTLRNVLQKYLRKLPHLELIRQKFQAAAQATSSRDVILQRCPLEQVQQMFQAYKDMQGVLVCVQKISETQDKELVVSFDSLVKQPLETSLTKLKRFADLCDYSIDKEALQDGRTEISPTLAPELAVLQSQRGQYHAEADRIRQASEDDLGLKRGSIRLLDGSGSNVLLMRVTKKDQRAVQDSRQFKQVRVNKADFQFTTVELQRVGNKIKEANNEIDAKQQSLALKVVEAASSYWTVIRDVVDVIGTLDVLRGFAEVAATAALEPLVRPRMLDGSPKLKIVAARHPLVERQMYLKCGTHSAESFVPNSITLDGLEGPLMYVITGANMGGKSTYIRQVALLVLMAQVGSFVPCKFAEMSVFDAVLCRIGASDDPQRGASTFLMEMAETASILRAATPRSLVIIDELGRGTSTHEGFGLAWEVVAHLAKQVRCLGLFATHFHEMAALAQQCPEVKNYHVACTAESTGLQFFYKVEPGSATVSYGLEVAKLAGLDDRIIERAQELLQSMERGKT